MISSINFLTFLSIGWGTLLGNGTGRFESTRGLGVGFGVGFDRGFGVGFGGVYFVGFRGSGNNLILSNFNLFSLRENFIFLFGTGESNNVFLNDLFLNLSMRFSIALYIAYRFFFLNYKN